MSSQDKQHKKYDKEWDCMVLKKNVSTCVNFKKNKDFIKKYHLKYTGIHFAPVEILKCLDSEEWIAKREVLSSIES